MIRRSRLLFVCSALVASLLIACQGSGEYPQTKLSDRCRVLASSVAVDEACAIEIAKNYVVGKSPRQNWATFLASFDESARTWLIIAQASPPVPDADVPVVVTLDGHVQSQ